MSKKFVPALVAGLVGGLMLTPVHAEEDAGWWVGGSLAATSDYVFRGVSQTDEKPAIQASLDVGHSSGFYAGVWGSNVDFDDDDGISTELNLYAGWTWEFSDDMALDLQLVRYLYPGAKAGYGINYNELIAAFTFLEYFTATAAATDNYVNTGEDAYYYHLGANVPTGFWGLNFKAGVGFNDISRAAGSDYRDYQLGVNRSWGAFNADLSYYETNGFNGQVQSLLGPRAWADGRVVLTLSYEF